MSAKRAPPRGRLLRVEPSSPYPLGATWDGAGVNFEEVDDTGAPIVADTFLLLLNAHHEAVPFILPAHRTRVRWELALDTREWEVSPRGRTFRAGDQYPLEGRSLALLRLRRSRARS